MGSLIYTAKKVEKEFNRKKISHGVLTDTLMMKQTAVQYANAFFRGCRACRDLYGCKTIDDVKAHLQQYFDHLTAIGKSADTVHTYATGMCRIMGLHISDYRLPKRVTAYNTRSRGIKASGSRADTQPESSPRLYNFAKAVGIRRAEYGKLLGCDFVLDESGHPCVLVRKGKGGKRQLQRIHPIYMDMVKSYFNGSSSYVFSKKEMNNKIDLHALRAKLAYEMYTYYLDRLETEPGYRDQLINEIRLRWHAMHPQGPAWDDRYVRGTYHVRGANRALALRIGRPTAYDKIAVNAVSVFHLSHWRNDVTVCNYFLSV